MTKDKGSYKVICPDLDIILLVRSYSDENLSKIHKELTAQVQGAKTPITLESYIKKVFEIFVVDPGQIDSKLPWDEDPEEARLILNSIYLSIAKIYPPFAIENVCDICNFSEKAKALRSSKFLDALEKEYKEKEKSSGVRGKMARNELATLQDINRLEKYLTSKVVGQQKAIKALINASKLIVSDLYPRATFFFLGPTGVGKTLTSKLFGKRYSGNFYKINCGEFSGGHEFNKLIGAPPGYVGHSEKSILAEMAAKSNKWVILFDEVEKSHYKFRDFLLSLFDDGTVTDNLGNVLDFTNSIFICTSNQGIEKIQPGKEIGFSEKNTSGKDRKATLKNSLKKSFTPEFLNRIDEFIFFNQLSKEDVKKIAKLELKDVPIEKTEKLLDYIVEHGYSNEYGARQIARFVKNNVSIEIADNILNSKVPSEGRFYKPEIVDGKVKVIETKPMRKKRKAITKKKPPTVSKAASGS